MYPRTERLLRQPRITPDVLGKGASHSAFSCRCSAHEPIQCEQEPTDTTFLKDSQDHPFCPLSFLLIRPNCSRGSSKFSCHYADVAQGCCAHTWRFWLGRYRMFDFLGGCQSLSWRVAAWNIDQWNKVSWLHLYYNDQPASSFT
jgi:hypothetical protein